MESSKILRIWDTAEKYLVGALATLAMLVAFYQVVMRYLFNNAPEWAEETVLYLIIWCVFIISSKLVRDDEHIGADFLFKMLPVKAKRVMCVITSVLALVFCVIVVYYGWQIVDTSLVMNQRSTTRLRFPLWISYLAIPSGTALIILSYLHRLYRFLFRFDESMVTGQTEEQLKQKA